MFYVYYLRSIALPKKTYIGFTTNLKDRYEAHNAGRSVYTKDDRPWQLEAFFAFDTQLKALRFEQYLKTNAGKIFLKRYVVLEGEVT
jgi:predicted GIY-YIG superfamily endonuclease